MGVTAGYRTARLQRRMAGENEAHRFAPPPFAVTSSSGMLQRDEDPNAPPANKEGAPAAVPSTAPAAAQPLTDFKDGSGITTLQEPPKSQIVIYHGNTLAEVEAALPEECGSVEFDFTVATNGDPATNVTVHVTQVLTMPQWAERDKQCPGVQKAWDSFVAALRAHENGHLAIDRKEFASAHTRFVGKPADKIDEESRALQAHVRAVQEEYDTRTDHGRKGTPPTVLDTSAACGKSADNNDGAPSPADAGAAPPAMQAKLTVNQPGDPFEQEADRIADQVLRMSSGEPSFGRTSTVVQRAILQRCACQHKEEEEQRKVQRKEESSGGQEAPAGVENVLRSGGGQALDAETRAFMEPRFGHDFSRVRIHADAQAADSAHAVRARAYTVGQDVVFGAGQFSPGTTEGKRLLAHELTHTVQQGAAPSRIAHDPAPPPAPVLLKKAYSDTAPSEPLNAVPDPDSTEDYRTGEALNVASGREKEENRYRQRSPGLQRDPTVTPANSAVPGSYYVHHRLSRQVFNDNQIDVRHRLEMFVSERDSSHALDLFGDDSEYNAPTLLGSPILLCDLDPQTCESYRKRVTALVKQEVHDLKTRMKDFKEYFQRRASDSLTLLLDDSEAKINAEKERYGLTKKTGMFSWLVGADYSMNDPGALTAAAQALLEKYQALKAAGEEFSKCAELGGNLPPGGVEAACPTEEKQRKEAAVRIKEAEYSVVRKQKEGEHPILITYDLDPKSDRTPGTLATLASASGADKSKLLYDQVAEKLANIKTTRDYSVEHKECVWKFPAVVGVTHKLPDVSNFDSLRLKDLQNIVVEETPSDISITKAVEMAALAAVMIGLGMIAAPLAAAGVAGGAAAVASIDAGVGLAMMLQAIHEFEFEKAATNTDLDTKARSISQEEPSLFWLAVTIATTIPQLRTALIEFRSFVRLSRTAQAAKLANNAEEATKLFDELQSKGNALQAGTGDKLRHELEAAASAIPNEVAEIGASLERIQPSTMAGYTHEIPLEGGKFWRRSPIGGWCFFASPPRCPLGVSDFILAPWLSGLSAETTAALYDFPLVMRLAKKDPRVGVLLEKYGSSGVKAMQNARNEGWDALEMLQKIDGLYDKVEGMDQLLKDLASGSTTSKGAIGEIHYVERLLEDGYDIKRVGGFINGKKAADIELLNNSILDIKYYDWSSWRWALPANVQQAAKKMLKQVALRKTQYPNQEIIYVFAGKESEIPILLADELRAAGVEVRGTL